ncbi:MAG: S-methyl-5-thioribose-1-phosphate isomerase [Coriobacteriales bacterium]|jgi:methylthioribose-1-phosphate isomerase
MNESKPKSCTDNLPRTIWWGKGDDGAEGVYLIDQTRLPLREEIMFCHTHEEMIVAIKTLALRGAPAIGVGGALSMAAWIVNESKDTDIPSFLSSMDEVGEKVANARPTAVNLSWGVAQVINFAKAHSAGAGSLDELKRQTVDFAASLCGEDEKTNRLIGENGSTLFDKGTRVMTHCNAGSLATVFYGTALGVIFSSYDKGLIDHVYACETRPVNQGGRLTAWELMRAGIPSTLICDNMSATIMSKGMIDAIVVGADRIAANGDTANKIGTMGHAVIAKHFGIPFYIAAPFSTIDMSMASGSEIVIEQRNPREIQGFTGSGIIHADDETSKRALDMLTADGPRDLDAEGGHKITLSPAGDSYGFDVWIRNTPQGVDVFNPAFDVTPSELISGIITEKGVYRPDENGTFHFE